MKFDGDKYIDGFLKSNLDVIIKRVDMNWDGIIYIGGFEGDGKTTLASQLCYYFDRTFNMDRVCFTANQFREVVEKAKPKQAILFDESYLTFNTGSRMSKETRKVKSLLTMIRKKQLFIVIVAPTVFDIDYYIICFRSLALINVYADGLQRGFFSFYNRARKEQLYIKGKKTHDMRVAKPNFRGRFTKWNVLDSKEYEKKKDQGIDSVFKESVPIWSCPRCESGSTKSRKQGKEVWCRRCGFEGVPNDFYNKLTNQRGGKNETRME